jgi:CBS domain-containing protein
MSEKRVRDLLRPVGDFPWVSPDDTLAQAVRAMDPADGAGNGLVLVVREDGAAREILGTISLHDVLAGMEPPLKSAEDLPIFWEGQFQDQAREILSRPAGQIMAAPRQALSLFGTLMEALHLMNSTGVDLLFVVHDGSVEGLLQKELLCKEIVEIAEKGEG